MEDLLFIVLFGVLPGLIPAFIAKKKGRNFYLWWFFGFVAFIIALPVILFLKSHASETFPKDNWLNERENCQYKRLHKGTGIAVDTENKLIHLKNNALEKSYPFSDIREWSYNISTGGQFVNERTLAEGIHNIRQNAENKKSTGFFVNVRDIENPQWRVTFPQKGEQLKTEMLKWMEIFQQYVNEN